MGLYSLLTTSASGMSAQSALLNAISDNIANVSTTGYKEASTEFSSLVLSSGLDSDYQSGSVIVDPRIAIDGQGALNSTTSTTDLAIQGNGFFIVQGPNNQPVLTRAGSFVKDSTGNLVNAAGYTLLGYPTGTSGVANGFARAGSCEPEQHSAAGDPDNFGQVLCQCAIDGHSRCGRKLAFRQRRRLPRPRQKPPLSLTTTSATRSRLTSI